MLLDHLNVYRQLAGGSCDIGVASPTLKELVYVRRAAVYTNLSDLLIDFGFGAAMPSETTYRNRLHRFLHADHQQDNTDRQPNSKTAKLTNHETISIVSDTRTQNLRNVTQKDELYIFNLKQPTDYI